ncbi:MAG: hypothetical protein CMP23_08050 [Rickettsiales bacterium]|nr:hypothetical protein [Rickettsiales bacterium]|tara:strand:+ start:678 stop:1829 length:1152 start_codon:yes stop_codon:yes gene_type:complete
MPYVTEQDTSACSDPGARAAPQTSGLREPIQAVVEAAARLWEPLPNRPEMAVPINQEGIRAVQTAISSARSSGPLSDEEKELIERFEASLRWAARNSFAGDLATPCGALLIAAVLAWNSWQAAAPALSPALGAALLLAVHGLAWPVLARRQQAELMGRYLKGQHSIDERLVRWLLSKGPLAYSAATVLRALLYGALIPARAALHLLAGRRYAALAGLLVLNTIAAVEFATMQPPTPVAQPEPLPAAIDVFGSEVSLDAPLRDMPAQATADGAGGWQFASGDQRHGHHAQLFATKAGFASCQIKAWAPAEKAAESTSLRRYEQSMTAIDQRWGPAQSEHHEDGLQQGCKTRKVRYQLAGRGLGLQDVRCSAAGMERRSATLSAN